MGVLGFFRVLQSVGAEIVFGLGRGIVHFFSALAEGFGRGCGLAYGETKVHMFRERSKLLEQLDRRSKREIRRLEGLIFNSDRVIKELRAQNAAAVRDISRSVVQSFNMRARGGSYESITSDFGYQSDAGDTVGRRDSGLSFGEVDRRALEAELAQLRLENRVLKSAQEAPQEEIRRLKSQVRTLQQQNTDLAAGRVRRSSDAGHSGAMVTPPPTPSTPPRTPPWALSSAYASSLPFAGVQSAQGPQGPQGPQGVGLGPLDVNHRVGRVLTFSLS